MLGEGWTLHLASRRLILTVETHEHGRPDAEFLADAKVAGVSDSEIETIIDVIAADPSAGDLIPETGGARKVRIGGRGKGKSGGYRVITFYVVDDLPVFLLRLVSKGQRVDISRAERYAVRAALTDLVELYRAGLHRHG
ncbi:type II toxin-antitoxin system RelE/ParE family toxin [Methylobacterium sp. J-048]|uniref:type II toxin-antitoxin system RelE/ParE family toxin n=1 Tax=Methylobacterium sp. J-048 TaxID=2836635 RepID=UPI001FBB54D4|nr:type II toxin-antitoxin system RelE/ParE family toxin [Methylobacterium sp. J-048]MCJ2056115.1 type II toxin-antitoxin system RelE/ParE family toxin [Methylobacterium sp. J-048]